ncbi:hypothetical protein DMC47_01010 [Nostoc sp. 3335mG]|nr:hypothetical protein DMC47_01010 [Nostoc sp. 3335mG]
MLAMMLMLAAQDISGPPADDVGTAGPRRFDTRITPRCVIDPDAITVCAQRPDADRLKPLDRPEDQRVFGPAAVQLSPNSRLRLRAENGGNPTLSGPRAMIDFTLSF